LKEALAAEKYEEAAELRDQLTAMMSALASPAAAPAPEKVEASREEDDRPSPGGMPEAGSGRKVPAKKARKSRSKKADGDGAGG
jgi:hypothetical protein